MKTLNSLILVLLCSFFISSFTPLKKNDCLAKKTCAASTISMVNSHSFPVIITSTFLALSNSSFTIKKQQHTVLAAHQNHKYQTITPKSSEVKTANKTVSVLPNKKITSDSSVNDKTLIDQFYKLEKVLKKYKQIEKANNWKPILISTPYKDLRPDATSPIIGQVRNHLFIMGDLKKDSQSNFYDQELMDGVMKYKIRNGFKPNYILSEDHINEMNVPISDKIKTLTLNMERCRELSGQMLNNQEYILVNIPSFELTYIKNGKTKLVSEVFVGTELTKTVIFNANIEKIVFSPYWTLPQSIVKNELPLHIASNKNYLADHNMEWINGQVRQKPGPKNSLGLVKFFMPNPYDIYMHDTPSKSLFDFDKKTFSHGCINIKKAKELAIALLEDYPEWTSQRIDQAMEGIEESEFKLTTKIPVYICYFTSWVNDSGEIGFFQDVYLHDSDLNKLLFPEQTTIDNQL